MSNLNPTITKDAAGRLLLSCDSASDGYQVFDSAGVAITRTFDPDHVTNLGHVATWSGSVAPLTVNAGAHEPVQYPAVVDPPPPPPPPPGIIPLYGGATGYEIINQSLAGMQAEVSLWKGCKAKYLRTDSTTGNQSAFDRLVGVLSAANLQMMPVLHGTTGPITDTSFAKAQAQKWKGHSEIVAFELCNEPDLNHWTPAQYAAFVKGAAQVIKAADPSRLVVAGALWTGNGGAQAYVPELVKIPKGLVDVISMHLYDPPLLHGNWSNWDRAIPRPGGYYNGNTAREILDKAGWTTVPIISTESGGPRPKYSEQAQADIVRDALTMAKSGQIASCCIYNMKPEVSGFDIDGHAAYGAYQATAT